MDGASLGKGAWPFSAEKAKLEVPINLPTDTISAVMYRAQNVGAHEITELSMDQSNLRMRERRHIAWEEDEEGYQFHCHAAVYTTRKHPMLFWQRCGTAKGEVKGREDGVNPAGGW
ncbi:hypothetical protein Baya_10197 [Bagarius yarrelli]|uniref:Uncharacterized protein n=1 Tax=Bagarius yarrelli TaxID=175774 RepID=A0A556UFC0_BAGYA|nr:hypothetical protein Baya_10197 [Bagarius yarrelli]